MKTSEDLIRKYQTLFEYSGTAMVVIETDGTISLANSNWENLMGYTLEEVKYKRKLSDFFEEQSRGPLLEYHQRLLRGDQDGPSFCEGRIITKTGKVRDVTSRIGIFPGTGQGITSIIDITESKQAEEALRESREMYQELVENINDVIFSIDLQGIFTYVSPIIERLYGYHPDEVIGQHFKKFLHPDDHPKCIEAFKKRLKGEYGINNFRIECKDGRMEDVCVSQRPMIKEGIVTGFNYIMSNITIRKRAEDALKESEEKYRAFFNTSRDCVFITTPDGRWIDINDAAVELFGYDSREELMQVNVRDLYADPEEEGPASRNDPAEGLFQGFPGQPEEKGWHGHQFAHHCSHPERQKWQYHWVSGNDQGHHRTNTD